MATMSTVANATTLTPPSSSHGTETQWNFASGPTDNLPSANTSRKPSLESSLLSPPYMRDAKPRSIKEANSPADSLLDLYGGNRSDGAGDSYKRTATEAYNDDPVKDNSKWIHRDKLAKIESEELQAAGIILPRSSRSRSKSQTRSRREQSQDRPNGRIRAPTGGDRPAARSRTDSDNVLDPKTPELTSTPSWDFRLPDEIAEEDGAYFVPNGVNGKGSKIPVAKTSPLPIPVEHIERDALMVRKRDGSPGEENSITYPKPRDRSGSLAYPSNGSIPVPKRAATDTSPKKVISGARKASGPGKPANGAAGRPKTRNGPGKETAGGSLSARPSTRSGELSPSSSTRQPEGEPPWMISAYRPDPRLPPDQQLLPTVARRLQQEKWEKEGKFGNIYDKEFRPLNDEVFLRPPEATDKNAPEDEAENEKPDEWPLRPEPSKSPGLQPVRVGSYSVMPKINDPPLSPMPSPRHPPPGQQNRPPSIVRVADTPEPVKKERGGCGCCIVM